MEVDVLRIFTGLEQILIDISRNDMSLSPFSESIRYQSIYRTTIDGLREIVKIPGLLVASRWQGELSKSVFV